MELCPNCQRQEWSPEAENADSPWALWCECPILKVEDYAYGEDELEPTNK